MYSVVRVDTGTETARFGDARAAVIHATAASRQSVSSLRVTNGRNVLCVAIDGRLYVPGRFGVFRVDEVVGSH